ncbi:hypothetical protein GDI1550 [Gluconacetobacter diazotrophicus PA1 5]|uniref:Uncharacterized protein n=1 Tax=Gluconacetobacter diazotrophicus (strain ATCC 49037 / DSM 5601 / CCUG 37298 / CIP 103539 / LMG 7603 / PAl5) TaxID=272568 RepID=A9HGF7_GLUDA|nr:hypothetical protein FBZ86_1693 [Gluconacetobacter diazotrophicus]CAP55493.1 hypothetical protein GDI1550 [Gluconacetobacter diazotrophicus PA1 5]
MISGEFRYNFSVSLGEIVITVANDVKVSLR